MGLLAKVFGKIGVKLFASLATEKFMEWLLFFVARRIVESTKNTKDDELIKEIEKAYYGK